MLLPCPKISGARAKPAKARLARRKRPAGAYRLKAEGLIGRFWRLTGANVQAFALAIAVAPLLGVGLIGASPAEQSTQGTILPGYWEANVTFLGSAKLDRWCVAPKDIAKFLSGPHNHIYTCTYPENIVGGGKMQFRGECRGGKGERIKLAGGGDYTQTTVHSHVEGRYMLLGIPIPGSASMDARRIADTCPPDAKAFR